MADASDVAETAYCLPENVVFSPASEVPASVLESVSATPGDVFVTLGKSRQRSVLLDAESAALLAVFTSPKRLTQGLIEFCGERGIDPGGVLEASGKLLLLMVDRGFLVPEGQPARGELLRVGDSIGEFVVSRVVRELDDTTVCKALNSDSKFAALKVAHAATGGAIARLKLEFGALQRLNGVHSPFPLSLSVEEDASYLAMEWIDGSDPCNQADKLRNGANAQLRIAKTCVAILDAYSAVHGQGLLHGDVHSGNILIRPDGTAAIIDFGNSVPVRGGGFSPVQRAGIETFFEPELAAALAEGKAPPKSTPAGEQYSVAVLLYRMLTGAHYLDLRGEKIEAYGQIATSPPIQMIGRGGFFEFELENVLFKALAKDPGDRFTSVAEFRTEFVNCIQHKEASTRHEGRLSHVATQFLESLSPRASLLPLVGPPYASVQYGAAGVALQILRIASLREDPYFLSLAGAWSDRAKSGMTSPKAFYSADMQLTADQVGHASFFHCSPGVFCVDALVQIRNGNSWTADRASTEFVRACDTAVKGWDFAFGVAGVLHGAALIHDACRAVDFETLPTLLEFGDQQCRALCEKIESSNIGNCEIRFTGIAHGWAGMLISAIRWSALRNDAEKLAALRRSLEQLLRHGIQKADQIKWPRTFDTNDFWGGWCNGSAGMVFLLCEASRIYGDNQFLKLAESAARHALRMKREDGGLCCGDTGKAYAFLKLYRYSGEKRWLTHAKRFAARSIDSKGQGLFKGALGSISLVEELEDPASSRMPAFELEAF